MNQMKCIKCISDNEGCIRSKKHNFRTIKEYLNKFFFDFNKFKIDLVRLNILILLNHIVKKS